MEENISSEQVLLKVQQWANLIHSDKETKNRKAYSLNRGFIQRYPHRFKDQYVPTSNYKN